MKLPTLPRIIADRCVPRRAHYVDNNASSARVVTAGGDCAGLSVESIGRFLRFIRLFAISKEAPVFSFHSSLNAAPGRRKKSAIIQPATESALVTNGECTVSLAAMRSRRIGLETWERSFLVRKSCLTSGNSINYVRALNVSRYKLDT